MSKINKIVTNYPVSLTNDEVENLSLTLSAVRTAGGGGGGSEGKIYHGEGFVTVNNTSNAISLTTEANEKLNQPIPTKVSDLTDSASYQTVAGMSDYSTKTVADTLYAPISVTRDVDTLKSSSSDWDNVSAKLDTTAFSTVSGNFLTEVPAGYATEIWVENKHYLTSVPDTYYTKSQTSGADQLAAAFDDILVYNVTGAAGIEITTATDNGTTTFGISMTAEPVVTDTNLSGYNGIAAAPDGAKSGWWNVGLTQDMLNTINDKLDSTDAAQTYQTKSDMANYLTTSDASTTYQPIGNYASASDIVGMATQTWVGLQGFITKDANDLTYYYKKTETSGANELATEFAKYVSTGDILTAANDTLTGIKIGSTSYTVPTTDLSNYYTKSETSATGELNTEFANKVDKPDTTQTDLNNNYLIYSTLTGAGTTTGWIPLSANYYSKTEADGRYQKKSDMASYLTTAQYETDSATFVTSSNSTITGTKQYALTTTGWASVETAYLPTSGGTVSGQLEVHGGSNFDTQFIKLTREGNSCGARIGLGSDTTNGTLALKTFNAQGQNTVQVNIKHNTNNNELIQVQKGGSDVGFLIPAVTATTTDGLTNDGILHIILES